MLYWDTSSLLKLYVTESDSAYFLELLRPTEEPVYTSEITKTEMLCALWRKERVGDLQSGASKPLFERFLASNAEGSIVIIPYAADVFVEVRKLVELSYSQPRPVMLRSLDAIHLASARLGKAKGLVATDGRLRDAALLVDLPLFPA